jgi:hypothetical protein
MNSSPEVDTKIRREGRLLYTLLDAVHASGEMTPKVLDKWTEVNAAIGSGLSYEAVATALYSLLQEALGPQPLDSNWIGKRWATLQSRVESFD